jgi:hypothetical protein
VKYSAAPLRDGCEPLRLIFIVPFLLAGDTVCANAPAVATKSPPAAAITCLRIIMKKSPQRFPSRLNSNQSGDCDRHPSLDLFSNTSFATRMAEDTLGHPSEIWEQK